MNAKNPHPPPANAQPQRLSYKVMHDMALLLIRGGCIQIGVRDHLDLSIRSGVAEDKTILVLPNKTESWSQQPDILPLNGREWNELFCASGVHLGLWISMSLKASHGDIAEDDMVLLNPDDPFYCVPAFFLKASGVTLPSETAEVARV